MHNSYDLFTSCRKKHTNEPHGLQSNLTYHYKLFNVVLLKEKDQHVKEYPDEHYGIT